MTASGFVSLVGAGPGDPELITVRGLNRLRAAQAVVFDRLIPHALLDQCPPATARYDVGKAPGRHGMTQPVINELLVRLGLEGQRVVRLKGGDPFLFGRGGEEALALRAAGVDFEVIPGVSSALAVPAAVGIPVTHRGLATSVTIATGHGTADPEKLAREWQVLAKLTGTLVFLMAVEHLREITTALLQHGRAADEPAALIRQGTTAEQVLVRATLGTICAAARTAQLKPPAVLVVGPTVALAEQIGPKDQPPV